MVTISRSDLEKLDRADPLASFRDEFSLPEGLIYLDGNSLGAMPRLAVERAREVLEYEWGHDLIDSWNTAGWFELPRTIGAKLAELIGAGQHEVVLSDSTGIDLFKTVAAALELRPERRVIVMEGSNFPTNNYTVQGLIRQLGKGHEIRFAEADALADAIDDEVAVICLTHVHYKTGRILDMASLTARAHQLGAVAIWDLCHSAGAMPVDLTGCDVDFAVGCTYKYLNGGPGSPAFIFAAERHHGQVLQPLTGWWGHAAPFEFERDYRPAGDIRQMLSGTQPILSLSVSEIGIDLTRRAEMQPVREKSRRMTEAFIELVETHCADHGLRLESPRDADQRGSQVSFHHEHGYLVMRALHSRGVTGDYRAPGNMRFGFAPLYLRYVDVWDAVETLREVLDSDVWRAPEHSVQNTVT